MPGQTDTWFKYDGTAGKPDGKQRKQTSTFCIGGNLSTRLKFQKHTKGLGKYMKVLTVFITAMLCLANFSLLYGEGTADKANPPNAPYIIKNVKINDYKFHSYYDWAKHSGHFEIYHKDRKIYSERICGDTVSVDGGNGDIKSGKSLLPPPGTDINGDGIPELVIERYSGDGHCCYSYSVYSLGKRFKKLATLEGVHTVMQFKDLDGDGRYEVIGRDWTFAYWCTSFAGSPAPEIILYWKNGTYRLAQNLMKKPPPGEKDLHTMPSGFEEGQSYEVLSAIMLELIYTGNGNLALQYCDGFWQNLDKEIPKQKLLNQKKEFLAKFKKQLRESYYWGDLKRMNRW